MRSTDIARSQCIAKEGVADQQRKRANPKREHDNIKHECLSPGPVDGFFARGPSNQAIGRLGRRKVLWEEKPDKDCTGITENLRKYSFFMRNDAYLSYGLESSADSLR